MKVKLFEQWGARDDRRLAKKPISTRLPVHILARISAICDLFPNRTRTEIMNDLLNAGLDVFEKELNGSIDKGIVPPIVEHYQHFANQHYILLEEELGATPSEPLFRERERLAC